uniref:Rho-GAP domain-containing protein n=1 Tax=Zosterops lateralis melanops TaxID=1220523 RepID=A0A8D2PP64_ZOSLA
AAAFIRQGEKCNSNHKYVVNLCLPLCIFYTGLEHVGIFRIGGSANKIKELRQKYNRGEKVDLINDGDVDSVASLLKLFLKELPVAVFPDNVCSGLLKTFQGTERAPSKLLELLSCLPEAHQNLLRFLSAFLLKVATYSAVNFMTLENLAIVFGPKNESLLSRKRSN